MTAPSVLVVGLGRIGSRFDEEPGPRGVWSHVGAYLAAAPRLRLIGGVELSAEARVAFTRRCPKVPVYENLAAARRAASFAVASICTPPETHRAVLEALIDAPGLRVVWCEKPMALSLTDAQAMVAACCDRDIRLVISHVRRWHPLWRRVKSLAATLGTIRSIRVAMPNRLWTIGSHAVDLLVMLGGRPLTVRTLHVPALHEEGEPARAILIGFADGAYGVFQPTGRKANLLVEAEVIGDDGRLLAREGTGTIEVERFTQSANYAGYRELAGRTIEQLGNLIDQSPFPAVAEEIAQLVADPLLRPTCSGEDALGVQSVLDQANVP